MTKSVPPPSPEIAEKIQNAAHTYTRRRDRREHPDGTFDKAGRWYPSQSENLDCSQFRSPSRAYRYSYMHACRTLIHCARLEGLSAEYLPELRRAVRLLDRPKTLSGANSNP